MRTQVQTSNASRDAASQRPTMLGRSIDTGSGEMESIRRARHAVAFGGGPDGPETESGAARVHHDTVAYRPAHHDFGRIATGTSSGHTSAPGNVLRRSEEERSANHTVPDRSFMQPASTNPDRSMRTASSREAARQAKGEAPAERLFHGRGHPLEAGTRSFMEPRFGLDLSGVRLHTDGATASVAGVLGARAFTLGRDIGFGAGAYRPGTNAGRRLIAHELAHTLQSGTGVIRRSPISDDIQATWDANPTLNALLTRLSRADVQGAQNDADIDAKIATLLSGRANDLWIAQRIRQGRLGTTAGMRPVEAHFVRGSTDRKALVIAGVHGSERQGIEVARMLLTDLAANQPVFTVIVVPSLFPDNAAVGRREGATPTNRNFPNPNEDLAAATAAGGGTAVDASTNARGARTRAILPENIMLLELIERFSPERIISIHGTRHSGAGGVFYDPITPTAAQIAEARRQAQGLAFMQVPYEDQWTHEGQERLRQAEERNFRQALYYLVDQDRDLSLRAARQIDADTAGITGRERRPLEREGETTVGRAERARRAAHPSVAGNVGSSGNIDTAFWSGGVPGGVSLGGYASGRGISIFTVEPPFNLRTSDYPSGLDSRVDAAERRVELQAYADAVRTVLLGR